MMLFVQEYFVLLAADIFTIVFVVLYYICLYFRWISVVYDYCSVIDAKILP